MTSVMVVTSVFAFDASSMHKLEKNAIYCIRLRAAPIFSQFVEREAKKKECAKIGDEGSGSEARKNEGLPA